MLKIRQCRSNGDNSGLLNKLFLNAVATMDFIFLLYKLILLILEVALLKILYNMASSNLTLKVTGSTIHLLPYYPLIIKKINLPAR